jgi:hypothetical protein
MRASIATDLARTVDGGDLYRQALDQFYGGHPDPATLSILEEWREDAEINNTQSANNNNCAPRSRNSMRYGSMPRFRARRNTAFRRRSPSLSSH